jgi:hypothetical protein
MKRLWSILITASLLGWQAIADTPGMLRVLQTAGDSFDYTFTTYTPASDGQWILAFNHRHGQTFFVRVGEHVGAYRITAFEPDETQRFVPSLNTTSRQKSGWVTLEAPDGTRYRLTVYQELSLPGRRATLVSVPSGRTWNVRTGDRLQVADTLLTVTQIADDVLVASDTAPPFTVPVLQPGEAEQLQAERQRREQLARRPPAPAFPEPDLPPPTARLAPANRSPDVYQDAVRNLPRTAPSSPNVTAYMFARESRYPVDYDVIVLRGADGTWQPLYLPRRFETFYGPDVGSRQCPFGSRHPASRQAPFSTTPTPFSPPPYLRIPHPDAQRLQQGFRP